MKIPMAKRKKKTAALPDKVDFDQLVGSTAKLYLPVLMNPHVFQLGSILFEVTEDESDGYRSAMQSVCIVRTETPSPANRFLESVVITTSGIRGECIYHLTGKESGHVWLRFGTDNTDSYYPSFVYDWQPKVSDEVKAVIAAINV